MTPARFQPSYGAASCYDTYEAEYRKYLALMWQETLGSKKRAEYERKANEAKDKQALCGEGGTSIFDAGSSPQTLWNMKYSKRKVDVSGALGPEQTIVAVAKGMNPGVLFALEDRATIKGGLTALFSAGLISDDPSALPVTTLNLPKDDEALVRAAGGKLTGNLSKDLSAAADTVRAAVSKHGDGLKKAAWGYRGLYVLATLKGFQLVSVGVALGVATIPVVGQVVAAALGAKSQITAAIANNVMSQLNGFVESGMTEYANTAVAAAAASTKQPLTSGKRSRAGVQKGAGGSKGVSIPLWAWPVAGAALAAVAYYTLKR